MSVSLTGADVIVINGRVFHDFADQDFVKLEPDQDLANLKVSKDGNTIYALNQTGRQVPVTIRLLRGSADDRFLNSLLQQMLNDFSAFTLMVGSFTKRIGDGVGNVSSEVYQLAGGVFKRYPSAKSSAEGDTDQSVAEYMLVFLNGGRSIG
jgi:hypothetical protein